MGRVAILLDLGRQLRAHSDGGFNFFNCLCLDLLCRGEDLSVEVHDDFGSIGWDLDCRFSVLFGCVVAEFVSHSDGLSIDNVFIRDNV